MTILIRGGVSVEAVGNDRLNEMIKPALHLEPFVCEGVRECDLLSLGYLVGPWEMLYSPLLGLRGTISSILFRGL